MSIIEKYLTNDNISVVLSVISPISSLITAVELLRERDASGKIKIKPIGWVLIFITLILITGAVLIRIYKPLEQPVSPLKLTYIDSIHKNVVDSTKVNINTLSLPRPSKVNSQSPVMGITQLPLILPYKLDTLKIYYTFWDDKRCIVLQS